MQGPIHMDQQFSGEPYCAMHSIHNTTLHPKLQQTVFQPTPISVSLPVFGRQVKLLGVFYTLTCMMQHEDQIPQSPDSPWPQQPQLERNWSDFPYLNAHCTYH